MLLWLFLITLPRLIILVFSDEEVGEGFRGSHRKGFKPWLPGRYTVSLALLS